MDILQDIRSKIDHLEDKYFSEKCGCDNNNIQSKLDKLEHKLDQLTNKYIYIQ